MPSKTFIFNVDAANPNKALVRSITSPIAKLDTALVYGDTYDVAVLFINSDGTTSEVSPGANWLCRLSLGDLAGTIKYADAELGRSGSTGQGGYTGSFTLATNDLSASMIGLTSINTSIEAELTNVASTPIQRITYQGPVKIYNQVISNSISPVVSSQYYTTVESDARYATPGMVSGGWLTGSSLSYTTNRVEVRSNDLSVTGSVYINYPSVNFSNRLWFAQNGTKRFAMLTGGDSTSGNLTFERYDNTGSYVDIPFKVAASDGRTTTKALTATAISASTSLTTIDVSAVDVSATRVTSSQFQATGTGNNYIAGRLGIGTGAATLPLDVVSATAQEMVRLYMSASTNCYMSYQNSTSKMYQGITNVGNWAVGDNSSLHSTPYITVRSGSGLIGIGTTNPSNNLQVQGTTYLVGSTTASLVKVNSVGVSLGNDSAAMSPGILWQNSGINRWALVCGRTSTNGYSGSLSLRRYSPAGSYLDDSSLTIGASGSVGMGVVVTDATDTYRLGVVNSVYPSSSTDDSYGIFARNTLTNPSSRGSMLAAVYGEAIANGTSIYTTNDTYRRGIMGCYGLASFNGSAQASDIAGVYGLALKNNTGGVTSAYGVYSKIINNSATNAITNSYGVYIDAPTNSGTITNQYGVYQTGSNEYNVFNGRVGISTTATTARLNVSASVGLYVNGQSYFGTNTPTSAAFAAFGAATAGISSLNIGLGTTPSIADGNIWMESAGKGVMFTRELQNHEIGGTIYRNTATVSRNASTAGQQSLLTSAPTLPANYLVNKKVIHVKVFGYHTAVVAPTHSIQLRLKLGSTVILDSTALSISSNTTNSPWVYESYVTCRTAGASGAVVCDGNLGYNITTTEITENMTSAGTVTVDTTTTNTLDLTVEFVGGDASDKWECQQAIISVL